MPNLLAHFGAQGLLTQSLARRADPRWVLLGCTLPDVPWIVQRAIRGLGVGIDPYELRLYAAVQASLLGALLLCAAVAVLARESQAVFTVLGVNAALHLLLDGAETKWANGVHFLAPLDWRPVSFGFAWPESFVVTALTALGAGYAVWAWRTHARAPLPPRARDAPRRWVLAAGLLAAYLTLPLAFRRAAERHDVHFVATLRTVEARPGRTIELDRDHYIRGPDADRIRTFAGEELQVVGARARRSGTVSVRATFIGRDTLAVRQLHEHIRWLRDAPSYLALALLVALWATGLRVRGDPAAHRPVSDS